MKYHNFSVLCFVLFFLFVIKGKAATIDSLRTVWTNTTIPDTTRLDGLAHLIYSHYLLNDLDSAIILGNQHLKLSLALGDISREATSNNILGLGNNMLGEPEKALAYFEEAKSKFEETDQWHRVAYVIRNIINTYGRQGKTDEIKSYIQGLFINAKLTFNDKELAASLYTVIGVYYTQNLRLEAMSTFAEFNELVLKLNDPNLFLLRNEVMKIFDFELENFERVAQVSMKTIRNVESEGRYGAVALGHNILATIEIEKGNNDKALDLYLKGLDIAKKTKSNFAILLTLQNIGKYYKNTKSYPKAFSYFEEELSFAKRFNNKTHEYFAIHSIGEIHLDNGEYQKSLSYCSQAYNLAKDTEDIETLKNISKSIYEAHKNLGNQAEALEYLEKYLEYNKTFLYGLKRVEMIQLTMESDFKNEKGKIAFLHKAEIERKSMVQKGLIGGLTLLGLLLFFMFRSYRIKQKSNKKITEQKIELEQLNHTKDRIFAIIGHDLRKPAIAFRGITKKVNYLLEKEDYKRLSSLGEEIEKDAYALNNLTDNLLNWALSQKNTMSIDAEQVNLHEIIEEVFSIFDRIAKGKDLLLISEIAPDTIVYVDKNCLQTILRNLVDNAIKYTPKGGNITVFSKDSDVGIDLSIKDTGIGIPKEKLRDIFLLQKGKSLEGTSGEKGTGLGLHLVYELVKLNKGKIKVKSKVGEGTLFEIALPKDGLMD